MVLLTYWLTRKLTSCVGGRHNMPRPWKLTFDLTPDSIRDSIRIVAADSIRYSIRKEISDSQVPTVDPIMHGITK